MQRSSPFLALLKLELLRSSTIYANPLAWLLMLILAACNLLPALVVWLRPEVPLTLLILQGWVFMSMFWWLVTMVCECSISLLRGVMDPLGIPADDWAEFLRSRAIDRTLHFRAKTTMLAVLFVLPMLANYLLLSVVTGRASPDTTLFLRGSAEELEQATAVQVSGVISLIMIWASAATIVVMQGYYGLVSNWLERRRGLAALALAVLPVGGMLLFIWRFHTSIDSTDHFSPLIRFILQHWPWFAVALPVLAFPLQRFCEKCFANQEVS